MNQRRSANISLPLLVVAGIIAAVIAYGMFNLPASPLSEIEILPVAVSSQDAAVVSTATAVATQATPTRQIATMSLPNAGIHTPIIDVYIRDGTWDVASLGASVGHLMGTAPLNVAGNHGLAGHSELRDGSRGIFAYIRELSYGDPIHIELDGTTQEYRVSGLREVEPTDLSVLSASNTHRLTLITCDNYDFLSNFYRTRVIVLAERVS
jgi:LPXTG-site transpeptidase (sortase) family protein